MDLARIKHLVDKTKAFYDTRTEGCALLKVKSIATHRQTSLTRPLNTYQFPDWKD